jgi:hypothetical protein
MAEMTFDVWVYSVFGAVVMGMAIDHFRLRAEVSASKVALAELRTFVAEHYVRSPELEKVVTEMAAIRTSLEEALKLLHELKGSYQHTRG